MDIESFIPNLELNHELNSFYFKQYPNKHLYKFQNTHKIVWKGKPNRNDTYE